MKPNLNTNNNFLLTIMQEKLLKNKYFKFLKLDLLEVARLKNRLLTCIKI